MSQRQMRRRGPLQPIEPDFYSREYFQDGTKSNYAPYGPGGWADDIADMVQELYQPESVLDVGCAYGYVVDRLAKRGVLAHGFDISEYAVTQASERVWMGDAAKGSSYRKADLILATELPEHLTPKQSRSFLRHAHRNGNRALLLIAMHADGEAPDMQHEKDLSHINIQPVSWWVKTAESAGWQIGDAEAINHDARSVKMAWSGRWLYLEKE